MTIKILLADVVGEAADGATAVALAAQLRPHIVLMDMRMPILGGVEATRRLHQTQPDCRVIVLTTFDDDELVFEGLRAGAVGYLLKAVSSPQLLEAIRTVARGGSILEPSVTAKVVAEFARLANQAPRPLTLVEPLSEREIEVGGRWGHQSRYCRNPVRRRRHSAQPSDQHPGQAGRG
jgi:DNA-binding NarL/FixJ family response regulator